MNIKGFRKKADASWSDGGTGLFSTDTSLGFGYSGATEGLGNSTNLPPGHQGHSGNLEQGIWSGDSTNRERYKSEFVMKTIDDYTPEQLIQEIRNLVKIDTPESRSKVVYLKKILDDKMRRLKATHEAYKTLKASKKVGIINQLKQDPFVISLFAEHNLPLTTLDQVEEFPEELSHFALHNLIHTFTKQAQVSDVEEIEIEDIEDEEESKEEDSRQVQSDFYSIITKSSPDQWPDILQEQVAKVGEEALDQWGTKHDNFMVFDLPDIRSLKNAKFLNEQAFYDFYAVSLLLPYLHTDLPQSWKKGAGRIVVDIVQNMAESLVQDVKVACMGELKHYIMGGLVRGSKLVPTITERVNKLKNLFGSVKSFMSSTESGNVSLSQVVDLFSDPWIGVYGGEAWKDIAVQAQKLESLLPVTLQNIKEVMIQSDHMIDMEHNSDLFLNWFTTFGQDDPDYETDYEHLGGLLDDKSNNWDEEFFAEKSPQIYALYRNIRDPMLQYADVKKFTKQSQTTSQPFKGKCPESGKTRYMTHTEYVQNDFKANCPEGKRPLEKMKSVSIEEFKKKRKAKKPKRKSKKAQVEPKLTFGAEEQKVINAVKEASKELGIKTYLVGGAVRDKLLGKENADMDFMCEDRAEELVAHLAKKYGTSDPVQYDRSQAMMVTLGDQAVDFINAEKLFTPLKKDDSLEGEEEFTTSFDDAYRRDLTINTLMYDINEDKLVDPIGRGLKDLQEGIINTVIDPFIKFKIHGADILRALRFAATLGFELGPKMIDAMKANAERITPRDHGGDISNRRIRRELRKAIDTPEQWAIMRQLLSAAGLDIILAEDISDVQQDFEGSIEYQWPEKEGSMRIKRFTRLAGIFDMFKKKEESLPALDKWLSKVPPKKTSPKSLGIQPANKDERIQFISKKLDEQLVTIPPEQQEVFVGNFLGEYKMGRGTPEYNAILSMLKNYKLPTFIPGRPDPKDKDIWRD